MGWKARPIYIPLIEDWGFRLLRPAWNNFLLWRHPVLVIIYLRWGLFWWIIGFFITTFPHIALTSDFAITSISTYYSPLSRPYLQSCNHRHHHAYPSNISSCVFLYHGSCSPYWTCAAYASPAWVSNFISLSSAELACLRWYTSSTSTLFPDTPQSREFDPAAVVQEDEPGRGQWKLTHQFQSTKGMPLTSTYLHGIH